MKLQFKHQKFQADAAKAVVDVFAGQPYLTPNYMMDRGTGHYQVGTNEDEDFTGWSNAKIVPELSDGLILEHIRKIQRNRRALVNELNRIRAHRVHLVEQDLEFVVRKLQRTQPVMHLRKNFRVLLKRLLLRKRKNLIEERRLIALHKRHVRSGGIQNKNCFGFQEPFRQK